MKEFSLSKIKVGWALYSLKNIHMKDIDLWFFTRILVCSEMMLSEKHYSCHLSEALMLWLISVFKSRNTEQQMCYLLTFTFQCHL